MRGSAIRSAQWIPSIGSSFPYSRAKIGSPGWNQGVLKFKIPEPATAAGAAAALLVLVACHRAMNRKR